MGTVRYACLGPTDFAATVRQILHDPRGWQQWFTFEEVTPPQIRKGRDVLFRLVPQAKMDTKFPEFPNLSVCNMTTKRIYINEYRWRHGSSASQLPLHLYQHYVINHEFGHSQGAQHSNTCVAGGAPVMMQQTLGLQGCSLTTHNPFPKRQDLLSLPHRRLA